MDRPEEYITSSMKRALTLLVAAFALPLLAEEPARTTAEKKQQPVNLSAAPAGQDSPLVAAARRSNRLGKKPANVITNKDLKKASDARITTTENQGTLNLPEPMGPTPEMVQAARLQAEREKRAAEEKRKREAEERRKAKMANAAERAEEGVYADGEGDDEAQGERDLQKANERKPPQV